MYVFGKPPCATTAFLGEQRTVPNQIRRDHHGRFLPGGRPATGGGSQGLGVVRILRVLAALAYPTATLLPTEAYAQYSATVGRSFPGSADYRWDSEGAVGPDHYAEITNMGLRVVAIADGRVVYNESLGTFWSKVFGVASAGGGDPHLKYDHAARRWYAITSTFRTGFIYLGVSETEDPSGRWSGIKITADDSRQAWPDYPFLGIDGNALYIKTAMVSFAPGGTTESLLLTIPKADVLGANLTVQRMSRFSASLSGGAPTSGTGLNRNGDVQTDFFGSASDGLVTHIYSTLNGLQGTSRATFQTMTDQETGLAVLNPFQSASSFAFSVPNPPPYGSYSGITQPGTTVTLSANQGSGAARVGDYLYSVNVGGNSTRYIGYTKFHVPTSRIQDQERRAEP